MLYKQLTQSGSVLLLLLLFSALGFPLYEDTADGRAATQQLYSFTIEFWFGANERPWSQKTVDYAYLWQYYHLYGAI